MNKPIQLLTRIANLFLRSQVEREIDAELRSHMEMRMEDNRAAGMSMREARRDARVRFGNPVVMKERVAGIDVATGFESIYGDVRFALRQLGRSPGFAVAAVVTLGLGIGANTAVFSVVDRVLLHPLPYKDSGRLMLVTEAASKLSQDEFGVAIQEARDYESQSRSFEQMGTYESMGFNLTGAGTPLRINAAMVSSSVFPILGVEPVLGRTFTADEDRYGNARVAVLSAQLWQREFGGDPGIVGKSVKLDEAPYTVVGVMPPSFRFPFDGRPFSERADLWVPDAISPDRMDPQNRLMEFGVGLIGRLEPGSTEAQARAEMAQIAQRFQREHADSYTGTMQVESHAYPFDQYAMRKARPLAVLLMAAVACVLLIVCANVANLLLERAAHRAREMAVRAALGARRIRLMRQCLAESLVLAVGGAGLGVVVAKIILLALKQWGPQSVPQIYDAALNPVVLIFTLALTAGTAIVFGFVPAWRMSHVSPQAVLKDTGQLGGGRGGQRLQDCVAVSEVALAVVLLAGGGLLMRSFAHLLETPFGFDPRGTYVVRTTFDPARYPELGRRSVVQHELLERLRHLPGVMTAAAASHLPLSDERQIGVRMEFAAQDDFHWAANSLVSPGYFRAMGITLLQGRDFEEQDGPAATPVAVVSEAFARQYLPGRSAIGQRFYWGDRALFTVIGVAADVHVVAIDAEPPPMVYNSMFQVQSGASGRTAFVLRLSGRQSIAPEVVRQVMTQADSELPLYGVTSMDGLIAESLAQRRFTILLLSGFAGCAVFLAMTGVSGVLSNLVKQREREIGLRMALGADRGAILVMIVRRGLMLGVVGCAVGLALSAVTASLLTASLYHVSRFDPVTLIAVTVGLICLTMISGYLPARRAASIDPMQALRSE